MSSLNLLKSSFQHNILLMKIFGLYPYDSFPKLYKIYALAFYILFTIPPPTLATIYLIVNKERDISKICDSAFLIVQIGILIIKLLPFKINPQDIKRTVHAVNNPIFNQYTPDQKHMVEKCTKTCRTIFAIFLSFCLGALVSWSSKAFIYEDKIFPIDIWLPFDPLVNKRVYCLVFAILFIGVGNAAVDNAALDTLIAGLICHAAMQIRILKHTLEHLGERVDEECTEELAVGSNVRHEHIKANICYKKICQCIQHYCAIYVFVKDLEKTYSFVVFTQLLASILVICISCYQLSVVKPLSPLFFAMIIYIITMLTEIFLYCYYGTILFNESDTVVRAVYMSSWYSYDQKSKNVLVTLIEMTKRPMTITAGKVFDLSLTTFTMVIRRSYSLLAVLKNY